MRIESVTAQAFGPLAGETLELAPGLTVVAGINESAKSSWHAALYAALCGRGQGAATPADRRLVERYKPWNDAPWLLSALLLSVGAPAWQDLLQSLFGLKNLLRNGRSEPPEGRLA